MGRKDVWSYNLRTIVDEDGSDDPDSDDSDTNRRPTGYDKIQLIKQFDSSSNKRNEPGPVSVAEIDTTSTAALSLPYSQNRAHSNSEVMATRYPTHPGPKLTETHVCAGTGPRIQVASAPFRPLSLLPKSNSIASTLPPTKWHNDTPLILLKNRLASNSSTPIVRDPSFRVLGAHRSPDNHKYHLPPPANASASPMQFSAFNQDSRAYTSQPARVSSTMTSSDRSQNAITFIAADSRNPPMNPLRFSRFGLSSSQAPSPAPVPSLSHSPAKFGTYNASRVHPSSLSPGPSGYKSPRPGLFNNFRNIRRRPSFRSPAPLQRRATVLPVKQNEVIDLCVSPTLTPGSPVALQRNAMSRKKKGKRPLIQTKLTSYLLKPRAAVIDLTFDSDDGAVVDKRKRKRD